ncbi:MAG: hypothetical protein V4546_10930 [Bacteroidota bacterium]|uniref:Uncharacterized protein n=1 Tax=Pedobacter cryotolerans TaxID=2571270 RepID=A0A4U1CBW2_9SPHI|nr:hypothetical protein [Pedobacter cryotolerans]TKC02610.1 hypothetical protein FA045_04875 [Pedobacter cryotolerans]
MVKIDYLYDIFENQLPLLFTLMQGDSKELFYICVGDQLVGTINKVTDGWQQIGGSKMSDEFINKMGEVIEHECLATN